MDEKSELLRPSDEFINAIDPECSAMATCEFCNRTYFEDDETQWDWSKEALEELRKRNKIDPSKVVTTGPVYWANLDGRKYVIDCPCNTASKYETFIWDHRHIIKDYLKARTESQLKSAQEDSKLAREVSNLKF